MYKAIASKSERTGQKAQVTVETPDLETANSKASRETAIDYAIKLGMSRPGISGTPWMEWVDESGKPLATSQAFKEAASKSVHISWPLQEGL